MESSSHYPSNKKYAMFAYVMHCGKLKGKSALKIKLIILTLLMCIYVSTAHALVLEDLVKEGKLESTIGGGIGSLTKPEISTWYNTLNRSPVMPPNYVFPIALTILYGIIGACGWLIWRESSFPRLNIIKTLYVTQLILNWSWMPLFFHYHLTGLSLVVLVAMDILVGALICIAYQKVRAVSLLMLPYLFWILFASY